MQAVHVHESDILERNLEIFGHLPTSTNSSERCSTSEDSFVTAVLQDESLFIAQLHRRSRLLDRRFKCKVFQILAETLVPQRSDQYETFEGDNIYTLEGERNPMQKTMKDILTKEEAESTGFLEVSVGFFRDGPAKIEMHLAPIKSIERMREKLFKYAPPHPRSQWPRTANILDPIRLTLSCNGPQHVLETVRWFLQSQGTTGLTVCRIKNKFLLPEHEVTDGYRDVTLNVLFKDASGLAVICEIQVHDKQLHAFKVKMHKLYKVKRANNATLIT